MGHSMGLWLAGRRTLVQPGAGRRRTGLSLTQPLSQNSVWEFPVTSRSLPSLDPSHPLCHLPKIISPPFSPHILLSTNEYCASPPPWIFLSKSIPKSALIRPYGTFMTGFGVPCARFKARHPSGVQSRPTQNKSHQDRGLAQNGDSQYRLQEIHKNRKAPVSVLLSPPSIFRLPQIRPPAVFGTIPARTSKSVDVSHRPTVSVKSLSYPV